MSSASQPTISQVKNVQQKPLTLLTATVNRTAVTATPLIFTTTPTTSTLSPTQGLRLPSTTIRSVGPPPLLSQSLGQVNNASRVTYLMPTSGTVTVVRPAQSVFVSQAGVPPRQVQQVPAPKILHPPIQAVLLQRGTTLLPVPSTVTNAQAIRPVTSIASVRSPAVVPASVPLQTQVSVVRPLVPTTTSQTAGVAPDCSGQKTDAPGQAMVVSRITPKHPATLPPCPTYPETAGLKTTPPRPALKISKVNDGIVLSWNMNLNPLHADISCYQLYAYQESSAPPSTSLWKKVGDVKALALPMACTLTQFVEGHKYHFAVRAVDVHNRIGPFSEAGSIVLQTSNIAAGTTSTSSAPTANLSTGIRV